MSDDGTAPAFGELHSLSVDSTSVSVDLGSGGGGGGGGHGPPGAKSGMAGATFNFVNSIVGAGIIGLPFAISECGFVMGVFLLVVVAGFVDYTVRLLVRCGVERQRFSYQELAEDTMGPRGKQLVSLFMGIFAFGAMVAYNVVIGDTIPSIVEQASPDSPFTDRHLVIVLASGVTLALCLLRDMSALSRTSLLSITADAIIVVLVMAKAPDAAADAGISVDEEDAPYAFWGPNVASGIGAMSFAFVCQHSSFYVFESLENNTPARWDRVTHMSVGVAWFACMLLGLSGYLAFFSQTEGDVLKNFGSSDGTMNFARFLLALTMVFTYPMEQFVARHSLHSMLFGDGYIEPRRYYPITLGLWGSALVLGLIFEDLGFVLELTGALAASALGYILPVLIYFAVRADEIAAAKAAFARESSYAMKWQAVSKWVFPVVVLVFGLLAMVIGTVMAFQ